MANTAITRKKRFQMLYAQLDNERQSFMAHWKDLSDFFMPRRGRFQVTDSNKGDRRTKQIIDTTPVFAARTLSSGMMSGMTSPARPWFRLTTADPDLSEMAHVKEWLHIVTMRMNTVFLRSNLYNHLPTVYLDIGVFATGALMVLEDDEHTIRCHTFPIGSYCIGNDSKNRVRVFAREFRMTVRQIVERFVMEEDEFHWSRASDQIKTMWDNNQTEEWMEVVHVICPNPNPKEDMIESKYKKFLQVYFEKAAEEDRFLEESGFDEFPVLVSRWEVTGEDVYGTNCPGMAALGDNKQLQLGEKRLMQGIDKMVNPPMMAPTSMRTQKLSVLPGDVSYADLREGQRGFEPVYQVNPGIISLEQKQEQIRYRINRAFFVDLFLMLGGNPALASRDNITAREIEERHEEKLLALGPVLEQQNQDLLDPLIDRTFAIMLRRGEIPEPPEELQNTELKVEYLSIMAQSQKMIGLSGLERFTNYVGAIAAVKPDIFDKVDLDQAVEEYADMTGIAPRIVLTDEKTKEARDARAQAQAQAQEAEMLKSAGAGAKDLSEADTSGKNALTDMAASLPMMGGSGNQMVQ